MNMNTSEKLTELRILQGQCDAIRQELEIHPPGTVIYLAAMDVMTDQTVVVEADGFGGATTSVIEGNYPVDYVSKFEGYYQSEIEAERAAEALTAPSANPRRILTASA